jgi:hypothetical protein
LSDWVIEAERIEKELLDKKNYGGTMRLGAYAAILNEKSKVFNLYRQTGRIIYDKERIEKIKLNKNELFRIGLSELSFPETTRSLNGPVSPLSLLILSLVLSLINNRVEFGILLPTFLW